VGEEGLPRRAARSGLMHSDMSANAVSLHKDLGTLNFGKLRLQSAKSRLRTGSERSLGQKMLLVSMYNLT
jgi:hypothetical protein